MKKYREVCLIEDDLVQIFLSKKFLEKTDLVDTISEFHNGKRAYDALKIRNENGEDFPEIIFLDLNMPIWDGWEFYEAFIKLPGSNKVKIYILTSSLSEDDDQKAEKLGLSDRYIPKPLSFDKLKEIMAIMSV